MGQQYSQPRPGTKLRVIGAGLPRTGTTSFGRALEILLDGPVYHCGTQLTLGPETDIKTWIQVLSQFPPKDRSMRIANIDHVKRLTEGFAAITDSPACSLVPELMEAHPDAVVLCTVRDVDGWVKSMDRVANVAVQWFLRFALYLLPSLRFFPDYINVLREQFVSMYGESEPLTRKTYDTHIAWLKEVVPPEKLVFVDVRDGWGPICRALDLPVPQDVPFPRINDGEAAEAFARKHVGRGLLRWATVLGTGAAIVAIGIGAMGRSWQKGEC
ncbi:hypothetical protein ACHAQA_005996 [Verticillium albo-atrum]